jgi:TRAP-type C4-dicarboxylate transport system permease small subunit
LKSPDGSRCRERRLKRGKMRKSKKIIEKIFDVLEIYLPMVAFIILFVLFIVMIFYRYIFYAQIKWIYELSVVAFIWSSILAASYGSRTGKHVVFAIVYDALSEKKQLFFRIIGNTFIVVTFFILLPYAYNSVSFLKIKKSPIVKLPFSFIFFPFVIFVSLTLIHHIYLLVKDVALTVKLLKGKSNK